MVHASRAGCHFHIIPLCFMKINEFPLREVGTSDSICMDLQIPVKVKGWYGDGSLPGRRPPFQQARRKGGLPYPYHPLTFHGKSKYTFSGPNIHGAHASSHWSLRSLHRTRGNVIQSPRNGDPLSPETPLGSARATVCCVLQWLH